MDIWRLSRRNSEILVPIGNFLCHIPEFRIVESYQISFFPSQCDSLVDNCIKMEESSSVDFDFGSVFQVLSDDVSVQVIFSLLVFKTVYLHFFRFGSRTEIEPAGEKPVWFSWWFLNNISVIVNDAFFHVTEVVITSCHSIIFGVYILDVYRFKVNGFELVLVRFRGIQHLWSLFLIHNIGNISWNLFSEKFLFRNRKVVDGILDTRIKSDICSWIEFRQLYLEPCFLWCKTIFYGRWCDFIQTVQRVKIHDVVLLRHAILPINGCPSFRINDNFQRCLVIDTEIVDVEVSGIIWWIGRNHSHDFRTFHIM